MKEGEEKQQWNAKVMEDERGVDMIKESGDESVLREICARNREWKREWKEEVRNTEEKDVKFENDVSNKQG